MYLPLSLCHSGTDRNRKAKDEGRADADQHDEEQRGRNEQEESHVALHVEACSFKQDGQQECDTGDDQTQPKMNCWRSQVVVGAEHADRRSDEDDARESHSHHWLEEIAHLFLHSDSESRVGTWKEPVIRLLYNSYNIIS